MQPGYHHAIEYLYLTTTGHRTGAPREIEIWATIRRLSEAKYGWGDGLVVELAPQP